MRCKDIADVYVLSKAAWQELSSTRCQVGLDFL